MYTPLLLIAIIVASFKDTLQLEWKSPLPMTSTFQSLWNTDSNTNHGKPSQDKTLKSDMTSPGNGAEISDRLPRWNPVTASPQTLQNQWSNKRTSKHRRHWGRRRVPSQQKNGIWGNEPTIHREQSNYQTQSEYKNGHQNQRVNSWGQKVASSNRWEPVNSQAPWESRVYSKPWGSRVDNKPWGSRVDTKQWGSRVDNKQWGSRVDNKQRGSRVDNKPLKSRVDSSPWGSRADTKSWGSRVDNKPLENHVNSSPWESSVDNSPWGSRVANKPLENRIDSSPWGSRVDSSPRRSRVDSLPWGSRVDSTPRGNRVDNKPLESRVDNSPHGRRVDNKPLESRVEHSPWGSRVDNSQWGSRVDGTPRGNRVDNKPLESRVDNSPWGSRVDRVPRGNRIDSSPWRSHVDSSSRVSRVASTPGRSRVDSSPRGRHGDSTPFGSRLDSTARGSRVDNKPWESRVDSKPRGSHSDSKTIRVDIVPLGSRGDNTPRGSHVENKPFENHGDKVNARPKEDTSRSNSNSNQQHNTRKNSRDMQRIQDPNNGRNSHYPGDINPPNVRYPQRDHQSHPTTPDSYNTPRTQNTERHPYNTLREHTGRSQPLESGFVNERRQQNVRRYVNQPRNSGNRQVSSHQETYTSPPPTTPEIYPKVNNQYDLYSNQQQSAQRRQNEVLGSERRSDVNDRNQGQQQQRKPSDNSMVPLSKDAQFQNNNEFVDSNRINPEPKYVANTSHRKSSEPANHQKQREDNRKSRNSSLFDSPHPPNEDLYKNIGNQYSYLTTPPQPSERILENFKTFEQQHNIRKPKRQPANSIKLKQQMELNNNGMNQAQIKASQNSDTNYNALNQPNDSRVYTNQIKANNYRETLLQNGLSSFKDHKSNLSVRQEMSGTKMTSNPKLSQNKMTDAYMNVKELKHRSETHSIPVIKNHTKHISNKTNHLPERSSEPKLDFTGQHTRKAIDRDVIPGTHYLGEYSLKKKHEITQSNKKISKLSLNKEIKIPKNKSPTDMIKNLMLIQRIAASNIKEKPDTKRIAHSKLGFKDTTQNQNQRKVNKEDPNPIIPGNVVIKSEYYESPLTVSKIPSPTKTKPEVHSPPQPTTHSPPTETSPVYQAKYSKWVPFYSYRAAKEKNNPRIRSYRVGRKPLKPTKSSKTGLFQITNNASNLNNSKVDKMVGQGDFGKIDIQKKSNDQIPFDVADLKFKQERFRLQEQISENVKMKTDFTNQPDGITLPTTPSVVRLIDKTPTLKPNSKPQVMSRRQSGKSLTGFQRKQDRKSNHQTILTKADKLPFEAKPNRRFDQPKKRILQRHKQITIKNNQTGSSRFMKKKANENQRIDKSSTSFPEHKFSQKQVKSFGDNIKVPNINLNSPNLKLRPSQQVEIQKQAKLLQTTRLSSQTFNSKSKMAKKLMRHPYRLTAGNQQPSSTRKQSHLNQQQRTNENLPDIQKEIPVQSSVQKPNIPAFKLNIEQAINQLQHSKLQPSGNVPTQKETIQFPSTTMPSQMTPVDQTHPDTVINSKPTNQRKYYVSLPSTVTVQPLTSSVPNENLNTLQMRSSNSEVGNIQLKSKNLKPQPSQQSEIKEKATEWQTTKLPQQEFNVISETPQKPVLRHRKRSKHQQRSSSFKESNLNQLQHINENLNIPKEFLIDPSVQKQDNPVLKLNFEQNPDKVVLQHSRLQPSENTPSQQEPTQFRSSKRASEKTPVELTHSDTVSNSKPTHLKEDYMLLPSTVTIQPWTNSVPINNEYLTTSQMQSNIGELDNIHVNSKKLSPQPSQESEIKGQATQWQTTKLPQQEFNVISETPQDPVLRHGERPKHQQRSSSFKESNLNRLQHINENLNIPKEFLIDPSVQKPDNPVLKLNFKQNPDKVVLQHSKLQPSENVPIQREPTQFQSSKRPSKTTPVERSHSYTVSNSKPTHLKEEFTPLSSKVSIKPSKMTPVERSHSYTLLNSKTAHLKEDFTPLSAKASIQPSKMTPVERSHSYTVSNYQPTHLKEDFTPLSSKASIQPSKMTPVERSHSYTVLNSKPTHLKEDFTPLSLKASIQPSKMTPVERSHSYTVLNSKPTHLKEDFTPLSSKASIQPSKMTPVERSHSYTVLNSKPTHLKEDFTPLSSKASIQPSKMTSVERSHSYTVLNSKPTNLKEDFTPLSSKVTIQPWINPVPITNEYQTSSQIRSNNDEPRRSESHANRRQIHLYPESLTDSQSASFSKGHKFQSHEKVKHEHVVYREINSHRKSASVPNNNHGSPQSNEIVAKNIHKTQFRTKSKSSNKNSHQPDRFINIDTRPTINNVQRDHNTQQEQAHINGYRLPENQAQGYSNIPDNRHYFQPENSHPVVNRHNPSPIYESRSQTQHVRSNHYDFRQKNEEIYQARPQTQDFTQSGPYNERGITEGNSQNHNNNDQNNDDNNFSGSTNPNSWVSPLHDGLGTGEPIPRPVVRVTEPAVTKYKVRHADGATTKERYNQVTPFVQRIVNYVYDTILKSYKVSDYLVMDRRSNTFALRSGRDTCYVGALSPNIVDSFEEFALYTKTIETRPPVFDSNPRLMIYIETQQLKYRDVNSTAGKYIAGSCGTANIYAVQTVVQDPIRTSNGTSIPGDACPFGKPLRNPRSWHVARCPNGYCPSMSHSCNIQYAVCCPEMPKITKCVSLSIGQLCVTPSPNRVGFS